MESVRFNADDSRSGRTTICDVLHTRAATIRHFFQVRNDAALLMPDVEAPDWSAAMAAEADTAAFPEIEEGMEQAVQRRIGMLLTDEDRRLGARAILRTLQSPATGIIQYARDESIDRIVIGTHGRGGVAHRLVGGVAQRVVRTAPCPVLTVRHPERDFVSIDSVTADTKGDV